MERIKKIKKYTLLIIVMLLCFLPMLINADSGFDSNYDSGESSSSNSSSGNNSSSSFHVEISNDTMTLLATMYSGFGVFIYFIAIYGTRLELYKSNYTRSIKDFGLFWALYFIIEILIFGFVRFMISLLMGIPSLLFSAYIAMVPKMQNEKILSELTIMSDERIHKRLGKGFDIEAFKKEVYKNYKDIQKAWMERNVEPVRHLLSDQMFSMYRTQLATLIAKNQRNMMKDIKYVNCDICQVVKNDKKIEIVVLLQVTCRDYIVDINNKVIRGNDRAINHYYYKLTFIKSLKASKLKVCPNCGAKLENAQSDKCEYCNTVIVKESTNFAMTDKKMLKQSIVKYK